MNAVHVRPKPHVVSVQQGDKTVLVDPIGGRFFALNETGGTVWMALCDGRDLRWVLEELERQYSQSPIQLASDVQSLIEALTAASLVECER